MILKKGFFIWTICVSLMGSCAATEEQKQLLITDTTLEYLSPRQVKRLELANSYEKKKGRFYQQGKFQQAFLFAETAYILRKNVLGKKHPYTLQSLNDLSVIYLKLAKLEEALALSKESYEIAQEILDEKHPLNITILINLVDIHLSLGHVNEVLPLAEKAYRLSKEVFGEKHLRTLLSMGNLVTVYGKLHEYSKALPLANNAYRFSQTVLGKQHIVSLTSMTNLAGIYQYLGEFNKALSLFKESYDLSDKFLGSEHINTLIIINNLSTIHQELGHLSEALYFAEKAYHLSDKRQEHYFVKLLILNNLAGIYRLLGRLSESLPLLEKAYPMYQEMLGRKHPDTLNLLNSLAQTHKELGHFSEALSLFEEAYLLFREELGLDNILTITAMTNLALVYQELGNLSKALPLLEKAYRLSENVLGEQHPKTMTDMGNLAEIYRGLGRLSEALPLLETAYGFFNKLLGGNHPDTLRTLGSLAHIYVQQGQINQATKHLEKLVKGVEQLRSGDLSAENRQSLFKKWVPGYFALSSLYTKQSRLTDAFRLAEMSKARTLLESLAAKHAAQQSGLTKAEQEKLQDYEARLAFLNNRIGKALENNRLNKRIHLETEKNKLVIQLAQFERELKAKYPKYAQLSEVQITTAKKGAKYLPKNAILISYLVAENNVLAFTLESNGKLTAHNLGKIPSLKKHIQTYQHRLAPFKSRGIIRPNPPPDYQTTESLSQTLGKHLLEPLKEIIKDKSHWIISPSGALALIPFETLRLDGELVIAQHQISYVQSLSILAMLQKRDKAYKAIKNRGSLFAMGAPIYEPTANRSIPSHTDFRIAANLVRGSGDSSRALRQLNLKWLNLPGALKELEQLEKLFKGQKPRIYKRAEATEEKLQSVNRQGLLTKYHYLVFSAHGYLSSEVPALSSIVLGQLNNPPDIDGYVTAGEWVGYDLKSDLMVLSACETGLGEVVGGEGVMGLPYALYVAGNRNTLLTLWSISDRATTKFIMSFFRKLRAGVGQVEALTATKREFLLDRDLSDPVYWAGFVLYGV